MKHVRHSLAAIGLSSLVAGVTLAPSSARADWPRPEVRPEMTDAPARELAGVDIEERPGALLPRDVPLRDQDGHAVTLGDYLDGKPVLLVLAYYRCPMLCSMVLNGLTDGLKGIPQAAGDTFRVVTVSIDPTDTPAMAAAKRKNQLGAYGKSLGAAPRGWDFLVGDERDVKRIADTVGFHYRYDAAQKQYAHAAGAFVFDGAGKLSRTLYGLRFPSDDLRLALAEAGGGPRITTASGAWEKILLFCYHYDPSAKGYVLGATRLMRIGGLLTMAFLGLFLARLFRGSRHGAGRASSTAVPEKMA